MLSGLIILAITKILKSASEYVFFKYPNNFVFFFTFPFLSDINPILGFIFYYYLIIYSILCINLIVNLVIFIPVFIDSLEGLLINSFISEGLGFDFFHLCYRTFVRDHYVFGGLSYQFSDTHIGDLEYTLQYNAKVIFLEIPERFRPHWDFYLNYLPRTVSLSTMIYAYNIVNNNIPFNPDIHPIEGIMGGYTYDDRFYDYISIFQIGIRRLNSDTDLFKVEHHDIQLLYELTRFPYMDFTTKMGLVKDYYDKVAEPLDLAIKDKLIEIGYNKFTIPNFYEILRLIKTRIALVNLCEGFHFSNFEIIDNYSLECYKLESGVIFKNWLVFKHHLDNPESEPNTSVIIPDRTLTRVLANLIPKNGILQLLRYLEIDFINVPSIDTELIAKKLGDFATGIGLLAKSHYRVSTADSMEIESNVRTLRFQRLSPESFKEPSTLNNYPYPRIKPRDIITIIDTDELNKGTSKISLPKIKVKKAATVVEVADSSTFYSPRTYTGFNPPVHNKTSPKLLTRPHS